MKPRTETVTILFTDIENSTRLWDRHPRSMQDALAVHDDILHHAIRSNHGVVVKSTGDGVLAIFTSATDAVAAAIIAQRELIAYRWQGISSMRVRMGMHTGDAQRRQGDYYGSAVNRAARLMSLANGEQILLSGATAELIKDKTPLDSTLMDLGQYQLRGLARPERVFQIIHPGLPSSFPDLASAYETPNNLPSALTSFVGRLREVAEIVDELFGAETRLLTLTGPGGVGKTRLSLQVADECLTHFKSGVYFVPLDQVRDVSLVPSAIIPAMGLRPVGNRSPLDQLKTHLKYAKTLLILDNFEHLLGASSAVSELLSATSRLAIVVTSRSPLGIYGEKKYSVAPLGLAESNDPAPAEKLLQSPAVRLFLERARAVNRDFGTNEQDAEAILQICTRLDGLPLAIELAAVRVRTLTPQEILRQLNMGIRFLRRSAANLPERQQTLETAIRWSHDLLLPEDKVVFRRLAVFVGGISLESADAVCTFQTRSVGPQIDVLDSIERLIDHSLITRATADGRSRFFMLETIREFALEQLSASGEIEEARRYHADYFTALAEDAQEHIVGSGQRYWYELLTQEHGNLRAALAEDIKSNTINALRIASALRRYWHFRGYLQEGFDWFSQALSRYRELGIGEDVILARALMEAGNLAWFLGNGKCYDLQQESVSLWRQIGDSKGLAYALWQLGKATWTERADVESALKLVQDSAKILRDIDDRSGLANALLWSGFIALQAGMTTPARTDFEESRSLAEETHFSNVLAAALSGLGRIEFGMGNLTAARHHLEKSLSIFRDLGDLIGVMIAAPVFGELLHIEGDFERAESCYIESMEIGRIVSGKDSRELLCLLSLSLCRQNRLTEARLVLRESEWRPNSDSPKIDLHRYVIALAAIESATEHPETAAQLLGSLREPVHGIQQTNEGVFKIERNLIEEEVLQQTGKELFQVNWHRGRKMNAEELEGLLSAVFAAA